jgi:hypothetical protein
MCDISCILWGKPNWFWRLERLECYWHHIFQVCTTGIMWCGTCIFSLQLTPTW